MTDRREPTDEIEITPEMMKAGSLTLRLHDVEADASDEIVRAIYEAMEEARDGIGEIGRSRRTMKNPKVTAHLEKPVTTIDAATGDVAVSRKGVFRGLGKGFQDYIRGSIVQVNAEVSTGQFKDGHPQAGKWAVQILISPCDTQEQANVLADKVTPVVKRALRQDVLPPPKQ